MQLNSMFAGARGLGGVRVSRVIDGVDAVSPDQQRASWTQYSEDNGIVIVDSFEDLDVSASVEPAKRPGMGPWITDRMHEWDVLLVTKNDRLFRSTFDAIVFFKWLEDNRKAMVYVEQKLALDFRDNADPIKRAADKMFMIMMTVFSEIELENTKDRYRKTQAYLRTGIRWAGGSAPYGFRITSHPEGGKMLVKDAEHSEIVREIGAMVLKGMSSWDIADNLNARGVESPGFRYGKGTKWNQASILKILRSPATQGLRVSHRNGKPFELVRDSETMQPIQMAPAIFTNDEWQELQSKLTERGVTRERSKGAAPFLGIAICRTCGGRMYRIENKRGDTSHVYYRCRKRVGSAGCPEHVAKEYELQVRLDLLMKRDLADRQITKKVFIPGEDHTRELEETDRAIQDLEDSWDEGGYTPDQRPRYMERIRKLNAKRATLLGLEHRPDRFDWVPTGETYLQAYERMTPEERRQFCLTIGLKLNVGTRNGGEPNITPSYPKTFANPNTHSRGSDHLPTLRVVESA